MVFIRNIPHVPDCVQLFIQYNYRMGHTNDDRTYKIILIKYLAE